jgi:WD40 repeat protein
MNLAMEFGANLHPTRRCDRAFRVYTRIYEHPVQKEKKTTMTQNVLNQFGNYRLIREIGRGGTACVYLARHAHVKHYAAVKVLTGMSTEAELFRQEAQTVMGLSHPHIIRVLDFGIEEQTPYLIMDYAPYGSLRSQYRNMVMPIETVLFSARRVAAALQHAHRRGIIHRDVKPENMLMGKGHQILLSDFGIAAMGQGSRTRDVAGTAAYMAPEQIRGKPCPASDQYALAITVYEWLCGRRPFKGTFSEIAAQHLSASPPPLRRYAPSLSPDVEAVILRALEKDPDQRFPSVLSFANALRDAAEGERPSPSRARFVVGGASNEWTGSVTIRRGQEPTSLRNRQEQANMRTVGGEKSLAEPMPRSMHQPRRFPRRVLLVTSILGIGGAVAFLSLSRQWPVSSPTPGPTPMPGSPPRSTPTSIPTPTPTPEPAGTLSVSYLGHTDEVFSVAFEPSGTHLVSGGADSTAQVWDATTGGRRFTYLGHRSRLTSVAWEPSGVRIASASADKTVHVWDAANGKFFFSCTGHTDEVNRVAWSPDGKRLASAGKDMTVRIWDASNGKLLMTYNGHSTRVWSVAFEPSGTRIASASGDRRQGNNTVMVWNVVTGATELVYKGHSQPIFAVAWSPDGTRVASGGDDATVQIWDAATGSRLFTYRGHDKTVTSVAWSPDGTRIASGSQDKTVHVWNATTGIPFIYRGHSLSVNGLDWEPSGMHIASASSDHRVLVWHA